MRGPGFRMTGPKRKRGETKLSLILLSLQHAPPRVRKIPSSGPSLVRSSLPLLPPLAQLLGRSLNLEAEWASLLWPELTREVSGET